VVQIFNGQADFLHKTPVIKPTWSKHCTEESTKQWSQPLSLPHLFSIYHQTAEAKGTARFMLILWWLNWPVMAASTMYSRLQLVYTTQTTPTGTRLYHTDYTYWYQVVPHRLHVLVPGCTTQTKPTGTRLSDSWTCTTDRINTTQKYSKYQHNKIISTAKETKRVFI